MTGVRSSQLGREGLASGKRGGSMMEWSRLRKLNFVRCPYCVDGEDFRLMVAQGSGDWFLCVNCGHLTLPSYPSFRCLCSKCVGLKGVRSEDAPSC